MSVEVVRDPTIYRSPIVGELKYRAIESLVRLYVPEIYINESSLENLEKVRQYRKDAIPTLFLPNHRSNADGPVFFSGLNRAGFADIADNLVPYVGVKLKKLPVVRDILDTYTHILVWPRNLVPTNKEEEQAKVKINSDAEIATQIAINGNKTRCVYIEGGREYDGLFKPLEYEDKIATSAIILNIPDLVIWPVGLIGTENAIPVGKFIPQRANVRINIGDPVFVRDLRAKYAGVSRRERNVGVADDVMRLIADLLPKSYKDPSFY